MLGNAADREAVEGLVGILQG